MARTAIVLAVILATSGGAAALPPETSGEQESVDNASTVLAFREAAVRSAADEYQIAENLSATAIEDLEAYKQNLQEGPAAMQAAASTVASAAVQKVHLDAAEADASFHQHVAALERPDAAGAEIEAALEGAMEDADEVRHLGRKRVHAMREGEKQMRKTEEREVKALVHRADTALHEARKAAHRLEKAQRRAGHPDTADTSDDEAHEEDLERQQDRANELSGEAWDRINTFFDGVGEQLATQADETLDWAGSRSTQLRDAAHAAAAQARSRIVARAAAEVEQEVKKAGGQEKPAEKPVAEAATEGGPPQPQPQGEAVAEGEGGAGGGLRKATGAAASGTVLTGALAVDAPLWIYLFLGAASVPVLVLSTRGIAHLLSRHGEPFHGQPLLG